MLLRMWKFTRAVLRLDGNSALQIKHLGAKFLWKQIQISFNLRDVRGGKCKQGSKIVCRAHLCFFSTKILWQKCVICCQNTRVQTDST